MIKEKQMLKKNIEEDIDKKENEKIELSIEPVFDLKESEEVIEEIKEVLESKPASDKIQFTIRRVDAGSFYVVDNKGNGTHIAVPKEYKNKNLKAGDIINVSKSEL
jgi:3-dehydroquinate dehydratase